MRITGTTGIGIAAVLLATLSASAGAGELDQLQLLNQREFRLLSEDLGAAASYKPLIPTEPQGLAGFDIGVGFTSSKLQNSAILDKASSGNDSFSTINVPTLRLNKGLPLGFDIGLAFSTIPGTSGRLVGGELRYSFVPGNTLFPAIGVRGSYSKLSGIDQLDLDSKGVDVSISKGFLLFTPYLGVGRSWISSSANGVGSLSSESFGLTRVFVGLNVNFGLINVLVEADRTGDVDTFGGKVGFRF